MISRRIQGELLDSLPPDHPDARHNRRDLRLTNAVMGNHRWITRRLPPLVPARTPVLELGAGSGELAVRLGRRGLVVDGLDLWPQPTEWPTDRRWHRADLRTFTAWHLYPVVIGNLIFHQFHDHELAELGRQLREHARILVACEPVRRRLSQWLYRWLGPCFGANHVSLHDAHVSIAAGFRNQELPVLLGLEPDRWQWRHSSTLLGAYRLIAHRRHDVD